jgi:hypothetical protein
VTDPEKWKIGGPIPEPGDFDEEIEAGNVRIVYSYDPDLDAGTSRTSEEEAERLRLKPDQVRPQP